MLLADERAVCILACSPIPPSHAGRLRHTVVSNTLRCVFGVLAGVCRTHEDSLLLRLSRRRLAEPLCRAVVLLGHGAPRLQPVGRRRHEVDAGRPSSRARGHFQVGSSPSAAASEELRPGRPKPPDGRRNPGPDPVPDAPRVHQHLIAKPRAEPAVDEAVHAAVEHEQQVAEVGEDVRPESDRLLPGVQADLGPRRVDQLVEPEEDAGKVRDEEEDHDAHEDDREVVLEASTVRVAEALAADDVLRATAAAAPAVAGSPRRPAVAADGGGGRRGGGGRHRRHGGEGARAARPLATVWRLLATGVARWRRQSGGGVRGDHGGDLGLGGRRVGASRVSPVASVVVDGARSGRPGAGTSDSLIAAGRGSRWAASTAANLKVINFRTNTDGVLYNYALLAFTFSFA